MCGDLYRLQYWVENYQGYLCGQREAGEVPELQKFPTCEKVICHAMSHYYMLPFCAMIHFATRVYFATQVET